MLKVLFITSCLLHATRSSDTFEESNNSTTEFNLHLQLFDKYNPDIRPVKDPRDVVVVTMTIYLFTIEDLDEKKQTLSIRCFSEVKWTDQFLTWKSEDFSNITRINVPTERIWMPDLALDNTADKPTDIGQEGGRAIVSSDGGVVMWPTKVLTVGCKVKIKYYPFDVQECIYEFLPWTNPTSALELSWASKTASYHYYQESGEWQIDRINLTKYASPYGKDEWDHIEYQITLRRKWLFLFMNILAPVVFISLLNVICFPLPAECGEKVTLCISIFLTLAVFLTIVNSSLPESSDDVSILGVFIGLQFVGSGCTILATVISIYFFHKDPAEEIPCFIRHAAGLIYRQKSKVPKITVQNGELSVDTSSGNSRSCCCRGGGHGHVTWQTVSRAVDRLCFVLAICWHTFLLLSVVISVQTNRGAD